MTAAITRFTFERQPLTTITYKDQPVWIAREVGRLLGYADDGARLIKSMTQRWANELIPGTDTITIDGEELHAFKEMVELGTGSVPSPIHPRTPSLTLLTESGLHLVCLKTNQPVGIRLRRWLVDEVLPQLARTGRYGMSGGERPISHLREERLRISTVVRDADKLRQAGLMSLEEWGTVRLSAMAQLVPGIPLPTLKTMASADAPSAFQALRSVVSWATDNAGRFAGRGGGPGRGPLLGRWVEGGELALLPGPLRAFLIDQRYDDAAILRAWRLRGWLRCEDRRRTARRRVGGVTCPCVVLSRQGIAQALDQCADGTR